MLRLPHIVKRKTGNVNETSNVECENCEGQFSVVEECSKRLVEESKRYKECIKQMLEGHEELIEAFKLILSAEQQHQANTGSAIDWNKLADYLDQLSICKLDLMNKLSACINVQLHRPMSTLAGHAKKTREKCLCKESINSLTTTGTGSTWRNYTQEFPPGKLFPFR